MRQELPSRPKVFEALRLSLSYLSLDPGNTFTRQVAHPIMYDICTIYLFDRNFEVLCRAGPSLQDFTVLTDHLLHILNFWSNQMCGKLGIDSYKRLGDVLAGLNRVARSWSKSLQDFTISEVPARWIGHYTCNHRSEREKKGHGSKQSCAEDWSEACPLLLDFSELVSSMQMRSWPNIFNTIPAFQRSDRWQPRYVRGTAHFQELDSIQVEYDSKGRSRKVTERPGMFSRGLPNALTSYRLRGILHALPDQEEIPGWSRMLFVLYKPHDAYMIANLAAYFDPANKNAGMRPLSLNTISALDQAATQFSIYDQAVQEQQQAQMNGTVTGGDPTSQTQIPSKPNVSDLLASIHLSQSQVSVIEDYSHDPLDLQWTDIDYAYAYEGILTPGGKVMLGRFWLLDTEALWNYHVNQIILGTGEYVEDDLSIGVSKPDLGSFVFWADEQC